MNAEKFENKRFETFFQDKLVKDKKSFLELFCQARLITVNEKKKKFLKPLSAVMEVCQAFDLLVKKAVEFTGAFKYAITLVPLAVATPQSPLYQPDKIGLRNYIISLSITKFWSQISKRCQVDGRWTGGNPFSTSTSKSLSKTIRNYYGHIYRIKCAESVIFQSRGGLLE